MSKSDFDLSTGPINYAIDHLITECKDKTDESSKIIYNALIRSKIVWENILVHGIEYYGLSYEEFCKQFENKSRIIFLSDDEFEKYKKALAIMDILNK